MANVTLTRVVHCQLLPGIKWSHRHLLSILTIAECVTQSEHFFRKLDVVNKAETILKFLSTPFVATALGSCTCCYRNRKKNP